MKSLVFILATGLLSYTLSDVQSSDLFVGLIFPLLTLLSLVALIFWFARRLLVGRKSDSGDNSSSSTGSSGEGCNYDGDSGGCGDGGGGGD